MRRALFASLAALVLVGCSGAAEQPILSQFFSASRLHDLTALRSVATTEFDPTTSGSVLDFSIRHVTRDGASKRVTVDADVLSPAHARDRRTYEVRMVQDQDGRWVITAVASLSSPPSQPPTRR